MATDLTLRQQEVLAAIRRLLDNSGRPPSIHELMASLGIASPNGVAKHLIALEAKGYIAREPGARGIRLLKSSAGRFGGEIVRVFDRPDAARLRAAYVPLVGTIAAGSPILAQENVEDILPVPEAMAGPDSETFFLRVKGESMIEEGIMPGDLVIVTKCDSVSNGELAAIMVEDEATVKRFYHRDGRIVLEPANHRYEPIVIDPADQQVSVIGKVTGLLRSYKGRL